MTKNLTKSFVSLREIGFASQGIAPKRCLDHAERSLNVVTVVEVTDRFAADVKYFKP